MGAMFDVHSSPCPAPTCSRALFCTLPAPPSPAASPACRPTRIPRPTCIPFFRLSAGRVGVQPAAEL
eukprot:scaffold4429_cov36-Phaeocystis_antarctica.AAC.3